MSGSSKRFPPDLGIVCLLTLVALVAALADWPGWLQVAASLPLVLILPGYALAAALYPPGDLAAEERAVYTITFSVAVAAVGGLATQVVLDLDRSAWVGMLSAVTLAAAILAFRLRQREATDRRRPSPGRPSPSLVSVALILLSLAIAGGAIAVAAQGTREQSRRQVFTSLWAVPGGPDLSDGVTVGVWNHGRGSVDRLEVRQGTRNIRTWHLHLRGDQRWEAAVPGPALDAAAPLLVSVYREGRLYRTVDLDLEADP